MKFEYTKHIPNEKAVDMLSYIQDAGKFTCDETFVEKRKNHDSILIAITIDGKGYLTYRNKNYEIAKNAGFIIDCNEPQIYYPDKKVLWNFIWVHFKGAQSIKQVRFILENGGPKFNIDQGSIILINTYRILDLLTQKGMRCDVLVSKCIYEIMTELMLNNLPGGKENNEIPEVIKKGISIIESEYYCELRIDALAKRLFTNKYELIRKFKKYLGITPCEYIIKVRINQAKILLESTQLPVSQISGRTGFQETSYFIKMFGEHEKITPLKYRQAFGR